MDELIIYGASDDLIEIEATAFRDEEFNVYLAAPTDSLFLGVSDGTLFRVRYDEDGIWRFTPIVVGSADITTEPGVDDRRYSDRVTMTGENLTWVALSTHVVK
jgi:hypothetical protein